MSGTISTMGRTRAITFFFADDFFFLGRADFREAAFFVVICFFAVSFLATDFLRVACFFLLGMGAVYHYIR
jgi:hypothetical protein